MLAKLMERKKETFAALADAIKETQDTAADVKQAKEEEAALQAHNRCRKRRKRLCRHKIDAAEDNLNSLYDLTDTRQRPRHTKGNKPRLLRWDIAICRFFLLEF